ncbi:poly-gamma-glutamate system protein [Leptospira mtsangambouensis]|nr:poly-gamma-glutamate system protein [Leptospira mtsangambouensis]MCG6139219.1 poly-gamma-glutamate system protein [Leptospira mtsangambouensis]
MMTKIYWSPWKHSRIALFLLAILGILGLLLIETCKVKKEQSYFKKKLHAAKLAERGFQILKPELLKHKKPDYKELDPTNSGLIGEFLTPVTSNSGSLSAKQTSINPNFAAVMVQFLKKAKLEEGDTVAVAVSGSFPALNICLFAALDTLKLKPIIISSASASQFGANHPQMLWLDMEKELVTSGIFSFRSSYSSLGGIQDKAMGISKEGKEYLHRALQRNQVKLLDPIHFDDSVEKRMKLYDELSQNKPIKLFINVGGGTTILGTNLGKQVFKNGLITNLPEEIHIPNSVIKSFLEREIPVINFIQIESLARKFGLPQTPKKISKPGEGRVFYSEEYSPLLYLSVFLFLLVGLYGVTRLGWGENEEDRHLPKSLRAR